jgi:hypothetical protein
MCGKGNINTSPINRLAIISSSLVLQNRKLQTDGQAEIILRQSKKIRSEKAAQVELREKIFQGPNPSEEEETKSREMFSFSL